MKRREFLMTIPALSVTALRAPADPAGESSAQDLTLWYTGPAEQWVDGLPLGNGRLGAMVMGGAPKELIWLNEATLWSGSPHNVNPPDGEKTLAEVRRLVLQQKDYCAADQAAHKLQGTYTESYQPLGELQITLEGANLDGYRRELNIDTAVCTTGHGAGVGAITREVLVSAPDQVIAVRLEAHGGARLSCRVEFASLLKHRVTVDEAARLRLQAKAPAHVDPDYLGSPNPVVWDDAEGKGMRCEALLDARAEGGAVRADGDALRIEDASAATLLVAAGTGFRGFDKMPDLSMAAIHAECAKTLDAAARKSWPALRAAHVADYQRLFRRVEFSLGPGGPGAKLPTDERVKDYAQRPDASLAALYFQFGRYLLIASSRPGGQPANLQGVWSDILRPAWSGNYTTNINVEMNYWPAETCNLSECHAPLFDMVEQLSRNGVRTARELYGMPGWTAHHNTDLWRAANPVGDGKGDPNWANWVMAAPWLCEHVWEHYRFTGDREFLRQRAWPVMKGAAEFLLVWLVDDGHGRLTTCPSTSPENRFLTVDGKQAAISAGCTMDLAMIRELFTNSIAAGRLLAADQEFVGRLEAALQRLQPFQKGSQGQLLEWWEEFKETEPGHRHMSHLYSVYPSEVFNWSRSAEWMKAAEQSLELRLKAGGGYTGWSAAWVVCLRARFRDGAKAGEAVAHLLTQSTNRNLLDTHPWGNGGFVFQIDGNFGGPAGIAEMLLQSHQGEIALLPALSPDWAQGRVRGLRARGGLSVDIAWQDGKATSAELRATGANEFILRPPKGQRIGRIRHVENGRPASKVAVQTGDEGTVRVPMGTGERMTVEFA
ncbi:MAG: glycoside hydrolase N-terminal domain-containing protein [Bryobacteraceae bacterium]|jgi:alpha-L-fucosidase 2